VTVKRPATAAQPPISGTQVMAVPPPLQQSQSIGIQGTQSMAVPPMPPGFGPQPGLSPQQPGY
jgi:hypothetical protein